MLTAECYKQRLEKGLTFLEFNYMLMQAYDFLELYKRYDCKLQMGGDDQWSNMLAGAKNSTLPVLILSMNKTGVTPDVNALTTIMILIIVAAMILNNSIKHALNKRNKKEAEI